VRRGIDEHAAPLVTTAGGGIITDQIHVGIHVHLHVVVDRVGGGGGRRLRRRHEIFVGVDREGDVGRPGLACRRPVTAVAVHGAAAGMAAAGRHAVHGVVFYKM